MNMQNIKLAGLFLLFIAGIVAGFVILYLLSPILAVVVGVAGIILLAVPGILMAMSGRLEKID